jgi:hypothetical protein
MAESGVGGEPGFFDGFEVVLGEGAFAEFAVGVVPGHIIPAIAGEFAAVADGHDGGTAVPTGKRMWAGVRMKLIRLW